MNELQIGTMLDRARAFVREGKFLHAYQLYYRLIYSEPACLPFYFELAAVYSERDRNDAAIRLLERAKTIHQEDFDLTYHLGTLYLQNGRYDNALSLFNTLRRRNLPAVHVSLGIARYHKHELKEAEVEFRIAVKLDPAFPKIYELLGELLIMRSAFTEAIPCLQRGVKLDPYSSTNHQLLGLAYQGVQDHPKAYQEFIQAIEMDPNASVNWRLCGESLMTMNRFEEAEPYIRKSLSLSPQDADSLQALRRLTARNKTLSPQQERVPRSSGKRNSLSKKK